ncbi:hypothetical protein PCIT_a1676 [Pseudoalteromonas citrea]|uniref:Sulfotransferase family protein n=2 Tax=Pseudoalteromonas citrea TaxID=43655 RepID=A0AAD4AMN1_9GAMM|nr:hypothetical protein [Pseudoalteromonas citrea]KAF7775476.1 hypothetical protein PCIT_a1676 [Pseudoalteromonas citrea]
MLKKFVKTTFNQFGLHPTLAKITNKPLETNTAFIHIAKCGGISIDNALRQQLATPNCSRLCRDTSIAASIAGFNKPLVTINDSCDFAAHHLKQLQGTLDYFLSLQRPYVSGHWGANETLLSKYKHVRFITMLREPSSRLRSNYIFNKLTNTSAIMPPNNLHTDNIIAEANELLFGIRGWQMANTQTAFICGRYPKDSQDAHQLTPQFAKNIAKFELVGVLEELRAFEAKFQRIFNRTLDIKSRNNTQSLVTPENLQVQTTLTDYFDQPKIKRHIAQLCEAELRKYEAARQVL